MVVRVIEFSKAVSNTPLNPLGNKLRLYIWNEIHNAGIDPTVTSIVLTGGSNNNNFSAGADLTEFANFEKIINNKKLNNNNNQDIFIPTLIDVVNAIERCNKPVIAAIQGVCLGGGCEVALACHYRIALNSSKTKIGLPEVHVGVIPGAGGTQRLPRLIGIQNALSMILTGAPVNANKALKLKLIDHVVTDNVIDAAVQWAIWAENMPLEDDRRLSRCKVPESPPQVHAICHVASLSLPKLGSQGLHAALEACRAAATLPFSDGMKVEGKLFVKTLLSEEGKARRHTFFAVRTAQKMEYPITDKSHPLLQKDVSKVQTAVIGAGTMGGGIALVLLQTGYTVYIVDVSKQALDKGVTMIHNTINKYVKRKKMTEKMAKELLVRMIPTQNLHDLCNCTLIVEAVIENMNIKQNIFKTLDNITKPNCIILSNTSTLSIDEMASVLQPTRQQLFAGWHFFSPANIMKLVEIVKGNKTSNDTIALLQVITKRIGKIGVIVGNCDGFCGNRLLKPYSAETVMLLVENNGTATTIKQQDIALKDKFGMALGPFQLSDLAGNDVGYNIRRERGWVREDNEKDTPVNRPVRYSELADEMVSKYGRLGQKVGKGYYNYNIKIGNGRKGLPSPEMEILIKKHAQPGNNNNNTPLTDEEIIERVLYPLVNEGFKCLEENIVKYPSDIDVVYLYGYGWPTHRGGPMYWADHIVTLPVLLQKLHQFHKQFPNTEHYIPSKLLISCVKSGITVEEYYRRNKEQKKQKRTVAKM